MFRFVIILSVTFFLSTWGLPLAEEALKTDTSNTNIKSSIEKQCRRCKKTFSKSFRFCPHDGILLEAAALPEPKKNTCPAPDKTFSNSIGMDFIYIPPGTFMMGSPPDEPGRDNDEYQRKVTLTKGFYIQTTEVTQKQWRKIMWSNPSHFSNSCGKECPVENVSWEDVQRYIRKLNKKENTDKYRLPTEAEWEYACRAGSNTAYANGDISGTKCGHDPNLDNMGWYCGNSDRSTHPVAQKKANAWGLYDMHGNVWELCQDKSGGSLDNMMTQGNIVSGEIDPIGTSGSLRISRGGSWRNGAEGCRAADRSIDSPSRKFRVLGFRLVKDL